MKVLLLTDSHFGIRRSSPVFQEHILKYHKTALDYAREQGIINIIHLGDFFDTRGSVVMTTLKAVKEMFDEYPEMRWHLIVGNHDTSFKNTLDVNSISLVFKEYEDRIHIYEEPSLLQFEDKTNVTLIPWITKDSLEETIDFANKVKTKSKVVLGHFEFMNFEYVNGIRATTGLDSKLFSAIYDMVLSGHYHGKSQIGNVYYLGTGTDFNWGDYGIKKYFHILDTKKTELTPIEYTDKLFHIISYDDTIIKPEDIELFFRENNYTDKVVRVKIRNSNNTIQFNGFVDRLYEQNPFTVDILDERNKVEEVVQLDESALAKTNFDIIKDFLTETDSGGKLLEMMYSLYTYVESENQ